MKLTKVQLKLVFDKNPELKKMIQQQMPKGCDCYLYFREKDGKQKPVLSFRSEG